ENVLDWPPMSATAATASPRQSERPRIFSGIQPTGELHIGNCPSGRHKLPAHSPAVHELEQQSLNSAQAPPAAWHSSAVACRLPESPPASGPFAASGPVPPSSAGTSRDGRTKAGLWLLLA